MEMNTMTENYKIVIISFNNNCAKKIANSDIPR